MRSNLKPMLTFSPPFLDHLWQYSCHSHLNNEPGPDKDNPNSNSDIWRGRLDANPDREWRDYDFHQMSYYDDNYWWWRRDI